MGNITDPYNGKYGDISIFPINISHDIFHDTVFPINIPIKSTSKMARFSLFWHLTVHPKVLRLGRVGSRQHALPWGSYVRLQKVAGNRILEN